MKKEEILNCLVNGEFIISDIKEFQGNKFYSIYAKKENKYLGSINLKNRVKIKNPDLKKNPNWVDGEDFRNEYLNEKYIYEFDIKEKSTEEIVNYFVNILN